MSLLNDIMGKVLSQSCGDKPADPSLPNAHHGLLESVLGMIGTSSGLSGILDGFKQNGLGNVVQSWIGTGANGSVTSDQVAAALGSQKIKEIAQKLGLSTDQAAGGLASLLPQLVDKLSPDGKLPDTATLTQMLGSLKSALAARANPSA